MILQTFIRSLAILVVATFSCLGQTKPSEQDLLVHLPLTTDLKDHSPNHHRVKMSGLVELRDGGAYFSGKEDWLELPFIPLYEREFSVAVWMKVTGRHPMYGLVEQREDFRKSHHLHLMLRDNAQPWLGFYRNDAVSPLSVPRGGEWVHVVFQYAAGRQQIWIQGRLVCERVSEPYGGRSGVTYVGKTPVWNNVPSKDFEGCLRDFRIYGRALSREEILMLSARPTATALTTLPTEKKTLPAVTSAAAPITLATSPDQPFLTINGNVLTISGQAGQVYLLQFTTELTAAWQPLATLTNQTGVVEYIHQEALQLPQCFYRIAAPAGSK